MGRNSLILLAALLLVAPPFAALDERALPATLSAPVILVVGDFTSGEPFGPNVWKGARDAAAEARGAVSDIHIERVDGGTLPLGVYRKRIIDRIAASNIVGIISADTSDSAAEVVAIARVFHVPALFTVATHSQLLEYSGGWSFRLLASDSLQAGAIASWLPQHAAPGAGGRTALLYDTGVYGQNLRDLLLRKLDPINTVTFGLAPGVDVAETLTEGQAAGVDRWIVAGYTPEATDFISKKLALNIPGDVLLTDGAFGGWLCGRQIPNSWMTFPTPTTQRPHASVHYQLSDGYAPLAHDAVVLISSAVAEARKDHGGRTRVRDFILRESSQLHETQDKTLLFRYEFSPSGENAKAAFAVFDLRGSTGARK